MSETRQYKAFVSSTYIDLREHRAHVIQALRDAGIHVDPMENWTADSAEPKQFSQERVAGCDLCILLVAFRRGYVPPETGRSITQLEYEYARAQGIDVLPFLLDEEAPWPRRFDEMDRDPAIREWRRELAERHGVETFGQAPSSLDIGGALARWLQARQVSRLPVHPGGLAAIDFMDFLEPKRRQFTGREWLFQEIEEWRTSPRERALLIKGDPGVGKSAIVAELVHRYREGQVLAWHCCRADLTETLRPGRFVGSLAALLAARLPDYAARLNDLPVAEALAETRCDQDPAGSFQEAILAPLKLIPAPPPAGSYLLIDALDEALSLGGQKTIVDVLVAHVEHLPEWLRIVATTRKDPVVLGCLSGLRALEIDAQDDRNMEDIGRYIDRRLQEAGLSQKVAESQRGPQEIREEIRRKSEGNFLFVEEVFRGIDRGLYDFAHLEDLPPGLNGLYQAFFKRHFPTAMAYEDARRVLEVAVAAQEPLTREQLADATGLRTLSQILNRLAPYLPARGGRYTPYHQSLVDWLASDASLGHDYRLDRKRGHERLVKYCREQVATHGTVPGSQAPDLAERDPYVVRYFGIHLEKADSAAQDFLPLVNKWWHDLWVQVEGTAFGFVRDVQRAWEAAMRENEASLRQGQPAPFLDLEVRCALCQASVEGLSQALPLALLVAMVQHGGWKPRQALDHARHLPQPSRRIEALLGLAPHLPTSFGAEIGSAAIASACELVDRGEHDRECTRLTQFFRDRGWTEEATAAAREVQDPSGRARLLLDLGRAEEAIAAAQQLADPDGQAGLLRDLALALSRAGHPAKALAAARAVGDAFRRARLLQELGHNEEAAAAAGQLEDPMARARVFLDLGQADGALAAVHHIAAPEKRAEWLQRLGHPEKALAAAREIENPSRREELLYTLALRLHRGGRRDAALLFAQALAQPARRAGLLQELGFGEEAAAAACKIEEPRTRARLLASLGCTAEALAAVREVNDFVEPHEQARPSGMMRRGEPAPDVLYLARNLRDRTRLPELLRQVERALAAARASKDPEQWINLVRLIASFLTDARNESFWPDEMNLDSSGRRQLSKELDRAGQVIALFQGSGSVDRDELMKSLDVVEDTLTVARQLADPGSRAGLLREVALSLSQAGNGEGALTAACEIGNVYARARLLQELGRREEAVTAAREVRDTDSQGLLLLDFGHATEALAEGLVRDPFIRAKWLQKLGRAREALAAAREITKASRRDRRLEDFATAWHEAGNLHDALAAARLVRDPTTRSRLLRRLGQPDEALAAARLVDDPADRSRLFLDLGLAEEALTAAREIKNRTRRGQRLAEFAAALHRAGNRDAAMAAARLVTEPEVRSRLFLELGRAEEALEAARLVSDPDMRARLLSQAGCPGEALTAARAIESPYRRDQRLAEFAPALYHAGGLDGVLSAAESAEEGEKAVLLTTLAPLLSSEELRRVQLSISSIQDAGTRLRVSQALAGRWLKLGEAAGALSVAEGLGSTDGRDRLVAEILTTPGVSLSESAIILGRRLACGIGDLPRRSQALTEMVRALAGQGDTVKAWELTRELKALRGSSGDEGSWADALAAIASRLPPSEHLKMLREVKDLESTVNRARVLEVLVPHLASGLLPDVLPIVQRVGDENDRLACAIELAAASGDPRCLEEALSLLPMLECALHRVRALARLAQRLPEALLSRALREVEKVLLPRVSDSSKAYALAGLAARYYGLGRCPEAIALLGSLPDEVAPGGTLRAQATACLGRALAAAGQGHEILDELQALMSPANRGLLLLAFVQGGQLPRMLTETTMREMLASARRLGLPAERLAALRTLAPFLPAPLHAEALQAGLCFTSSDDRADALAALPATLAASVRDQALAAARALPAPGERLKLLAALGSHLTLREREQVCEQARDLRSLRDQVKTFTLLAPHLPRQHEQLYKDALAAASQMIDPLDQVQALALIPSSCWDGAHLQRVLPAVARMDGCRSRSMALACLMPGLQEEHLPLLYPCWRTLLARMVRSSRREIFQTLRQLAPVIGILGGPAIPAATYRVVQEVGKWWP